MERIENKLDQEIKNLKSGLKSGRAFDIADKEDMASLVALSKVLNSFPKKTVPQPIMQRKYILEPVQGKLKIFFSFKKIIAISAAALVGIISYTSYVAASSVPGQNLFALKKAAEKISLAFTTDPVKKANLELALAQERLNEAQSAFRSPTKNPELEVAALNELTSQTNSALDQVKTVASNNSISSTDHPIVNSAVALNNQQQALISQAQAQNTISTQSPATQMALNSQNKITEIKNLVIAASNEQKLTNLNASSTPATATSTTTTASTTGAGSSVKPDYKPQPKDNSTSTTTSEAATTTEQTDPNAAIGTAIFETPNQ